MSTLSNDEYVKADIAAVQLDAEPSLLQPIDRTTPSDLQVVVQLAEPP